MGIVLISLFICFGVWAKSLEQKKVELKKIYEAGGITKSEYNKSQDFLKNFEEKKKEKKSKPTFDLNKKKNSEIKSILKKNKDKKEKITLKKIEELGQIIKFDDTYFTDAMIKVFGKGCNNSFKCKAQKAGGYMSKAFSRSKSYGQKNPGKMIKAMAMFEVFYASKLWYSRKSIERYKENNYKKSKFSKKKKG